MKEMTEATSSTAKAEEHDNTDASPAITTTRKSRREIKPPRRLEEDAAYKELDRPKKKRKSKSKNEKKKEPAQGKNQDEQNSGNDGGNGEVEDGVNADTNTEKKQKGVENEKAADISPSNSASSQNGSNSNSNGRKNSTSKKPKFNVRKTKQGNTYIIKPKQIHTTNIDISDYEDGVAISNATLSQITKSLKKPPQFKPSKALQSQFIQIPSHNCRARIYLECARAIAQKEAKALPSHGARPWQCFVTMWDRQGSRATASSYNVKDDVHGKFECKKGGSGGGGTKGGKKGGMASSPLFLWNKHRLELAVLPHLLDVVDVIDTNHGLLRSVQNDISSMEDEQHEGKGKGRTSTNKKKKNLTKDEEDQLYIEELIARPFTELSTVALNDSSFVVPSIERKWISPNLVTFKSRNAAIEHSLMLLDKDKLVDRVLHGIGSRGALLRAVKPTRKLALDAGYWRFERDGLWVIGQEEDWIEERMNYLNAQEEEEEEDALVEAQEKELGSENGNVDNLPGSGDADVTMKETPSDVTSESYPENNEDLSSTVRSEEQQKDSEPQVATVENEIEDDQQLEERSMEGHRPSQDQESASRDKEESLLTPSSPQKSPDTIIDDVSNAIIPPNEISDESVTDQPDQIERSCKPAQDSILDDEIALPVKNSVVYDVQNGPDVIVTCTSDSKETTSVKKPKKKRRCYKITPSNHWRLTQEQIDLCYSAIMNFYEKVMYTVKAKALHPELADGFDVFRERGRGRFDMQLEEFDTPEFSFLTDLTSAAWMPVVKKILGEDATMVHKGAFLSMPGSETQVYHQDGVHLNKKFQKPCHAINVFIPLVDLTEKNGPTEFCIGTHFLGYDAYSKEMVDTPLAPAGTPIIFDYRLGHRGLGNSSREPRPIVYLTYTKSSKEFRDSVNFSKSKWRKLGEIVEKPMSREERALKRMREAD